MNFTSDLFQGVSVQLNDLKTAEAKAQNISKHDTVKKVWPVYLYDLPKPKYQVVDPSAAAQFSSNDTDTFGPHVMMQVDKMRAKGITGKGIKVAVIDSGVSIKSTTMIRAEADSLSGRL